MFHNSCIIPQFNTTTLTAAYLMHNRCQPCCLPLQLCPKGDWRSLMEPTRQAARQLAHQGLIDITQKGQVGVYTWESPGLHAGLTQSKLIFST